MVSEDYEDDFDKSLTHSKITSSFNPSKSSKLQQIKLSNDDFTKSSHFQQESIKEIYEDSFPEDIAASYGANKLPSNKPEDSYN